jgi:hypothetical protein
VPNWALTIRLGDVVTRWKQGDLDITELAEKVTERIKDSRWRSFTADTEGFDTAMADLAGITTRYEYEQIFEAVYDLADLDRVWIETW